MVKGSERGCGVCDEQSDRSRGAGKDGGIVRSPQVKAADQKGNISYE